MPRSQPVEQRFWKRVEKTETCWNWIGGTTSRGYGSLHVHKRAQLAHRVIYELTYGPFPNELYVCHHCDNPRCVRPDHLFLGTQADNMHDMIRKGRKKNRTPKQGMRKEKTYRERKVSHRDQRGERNNRAKLTALQVDEIRQAVATKTHNMYQLARIYSVHRDHIRNIIRHKKWQTVD